MFQQHHIDKIGNILKENVRKQFLEITKVLKESYEENPYIRTAEVYVDGENVKIKLNLTFEPVDAEEQNIVNLFEVGGVIYKDNDGEKELIEINGGYYIRNAFGAFPK